MELTINHDKYSPDGLGAKVQPKNGYGTNVTGKWLEDAVALDAAILGAAPDIMAIVDKLFPKLLDAIANNPNSKIKNTKTTGSKSRIKYACKTVLFNLYVAYLMDAPVRYSRRKGSYARDERYGQIFIHYARLTATVSAFETLGLIHQKAGLFDRKKSLGRQSRMWASGKLVFLFKEATQDLPQPVYQEERGERVELRNSDKKPIGYIDTNQTILIRDNLNQYNDFISQQEVKVLADGSRKISLYGLNSKMLLSLLKGKATMLNLSLLNNHEYYYKYKNSIHNYSSNIINHDSSNINIVNNDSSIILHNYYNNILSNTSMTGSFLSLLSDRRINYRKDNSKYFDWLFPEDKQFTYGNFINQATFENIHNLNLLSRFIQKKLLAHNNKPKKLKAKAIKKKVTLRNFGIGQFDFVINSKKLYRVFNNDSFEQGGRFYGALYQTMPKEFRRDILINGEPTVELDYAAHHIRMSYHREGIDYREDPYTPFADEKERRKVFKKLMLVSLNAETEKEAVKAFRSECIDIAWKTNLSLTNKSILGLLERAREIHHRIAKYIHSDRGRELQNLDSRITEKILMRMTDKGVPCLPVHDSYIVPRQFENQLRGAMNEEYEALLGFEPIIG